MARLKGTDTGISYRYNAANQVIKRAVVAIPTPTTEYWYRFGGKQLAYVGNNITSTSDYVTSVNSRVSGSTTGTVNDTDQGYDPLNSFDSGSLAGGYTVQSGDTLSGIAARLWGDASLWYKIAEVNGLAGDETLTEGQILTIPPGIIRNTYTAATFTPYDPAEALGNTVPAPPKAREHGCGVFGQIFLAVIAIAVFVATRDFLISADIFAKGSFALAATAAATASVVSQGVGVATGIQDKFSWGAVALSALTAGLGEAGVGNVVAKTFGASGAAIAPAGAVINNVITQGVALATHMQSNFSWASVAGAALGSAPSTYVYGQVVNSVGPGVAQVIAGAASDLVNAAARSLLDGQDFGDAMLDALGDSFAQLAGNALAGALGGASAPVAPTPKPVAASDFGKAPTPTPLLPDDLAKAPTSSDPSAFSKKDETPPFVDTKLDAESEPTDGSIVAIVARGLDPTRLLPLTPNQIIAYKEALAVARKIHPGPGVGPLHVPEVATTHYAGNGNNDLDVTPTNWIEFG